MECGDGADPDCACPANTFVDRNACVACPAGTTNPAGDDAAGVETTCDATLCAANEFVSSNVCTPCRPGTTNDAGDDASGDDTVCDAVICGVDEFVSANVCAPCLAGSNNDAGDVASGGDTTCDPIFCDEDEFVSEHVCTACAPGSSNESGDSALSGDTMCDAVLCASSEFVAANVCTPCAPGTTNAPFDDASGDDTMCDPIICLADERVSSNACESCPPGTTNAVGDDASGADTMCDPTLCEENEFVFGNVCEACPAGTVNEAGDDASGPDTMCGDACFDALGVTCDEFEGPYVKASNTDASDEFGYSVALSADGSTLAVGAIGEASSATGVGGDETIDTPQPSGAVYVFFHRRGGWVQQAYLKASNTDADDEFGTSVALSADGDILVVGAPGEDSDATGVGGDQASGAASNSGAVYVFTRTGGWIQEAYIKASNTDIGDEFGTSVAISSDGFALAVGAPGEDGMGGDETSDAVPSSGAGWRRNWH